MAAITNRKTAISIKKDQDHREPAGRFRAGGLAVAVCRVTVGEGTGRSGLGEGQLARGGVVNKKIRGAAPLDGGVQLAPCFVFAEMFIKEIAEEFIGKRA